jgi:hypothetical protein
MRTAKNRDGIELQIRNDVADLTLNEAAALMFISSDVKKLFAFTKQLEGVTDPEDDLKICMENGFGVFHAPDPFAEMTKPEILEWHVWMLWLAHSGMPVDGTAAAMDWCLRGGLKTVTEYYDWRARGGCWWDRSTPEELAETIQEWHTFKATKSNLSLEMIVEELNALAAQDAARPSKPRRHKTRRRRAA